MSEKSFLNDVLPLKNMLFRLALRITLNKADAEDIVQETMLKVWSRREQWHEIESMEAFCITICRNLSLDRQKRMDRANTTLDNEYHDAPDNSYASDPEEQTVQRDRVALVRRLMDTLPEKQRTCMQLRDVEGKAYKEIAKVMGITEQQVKVNIFRARQTIKQKFYDNETYGLQVH
jgi:RNA polymerase sigma-70 factor (ECF subfamily)